MKFSCAQFSPKLHWNIISTVGPGLRSQVSGGLQDPPETWLMVLMCLFWIFRASTNWWSSSGTTSSRPPRWVPLLYYHILMRWVSSLLMICSECLKLEVYNAVSSPRIVTMANQVLTINVTENVRKFSFLIQILSALFISCCIFSELKT